ncbi:MAG: hypothetical protein V1823_00930 [Chloroflexota bacterium]
MSYKCPVCQAKFTKTSSAMCIHMLDTDDYLNDKHRQWITSHGIDFMAMLRFKAGRQVKGSYEPLIAIIESECKVEEQPPEGKPTDSKGKHYNTHLPGQKG